MSETFSWIEGSAQFITGGATATMTYARNITVTRTIGWHAYRPPRSTTYQYIETGRVAQVSFEQDWSDQETLQNHFTAASAGGVHARLIHQIGGGGASGGMLLYSGVLQTHAVRGRDGGVMGQSVQGMFQNWSDF